MPPPRRLSSRARCSTIRAPDMPTGWPRAIAPPLTLTLSSGMPSSRADSMPTAAKASLNSTRSTSSTAMPSFASAFAVALAGCSCSVESGPATWPWAPISASHVEAELLGLGLAHHDDGAGAVGDLRGGAGGDGAVLAERRAQLAERLGGGVAADALVLADDDRVALALRDRRPARPRRRRGRSSRPSAASWCERAANSSCSSRVSLAPSALHCSVSPPIACWVAWSKSAS